MWNIYQSIIWGGNGGWIAEKSDIGVRVEIEEVLLEVVENRVERVVKVSNVGVGVVHVRGRS